MTEIQREFVKRIIDECAKSSSIRSLNSTLVQLNKEICAQVPPIEQERLLYITTTIYYLMNEVDNLEKQGQMLITPRTKFLMAVSMKTRAETGSIEGFWKSCREIYEYACTYVLGAVLSTGEVVSAIRIAAGGLFGIMLCLPGDSSDRSYCQQRFRNCTSGIPDGCGICLQFCIVQGYWPPYSTHKCS